MKVAYYCRPIEIRLDTAPEEIQHCCRAFLFCHRLSRYLLKLCDLTAGIKSSQLFDFKSFFDFKKKWRAIPVPFSPFSRPCYFFFLDNQNNKSEITSGKSILTKRKKAKHCRIISLDSFSAIYANSNKGLGTQ